MGGASKVKGDLNMKKSIPTCKIDEFNKKINFLNNKLVKYGKQKLEAKEIERYTRSIKYQNNNGEWDYMTVEFADFEITEIMLDYFIRKIHARNFLSRPRILICCPTNVTPVEKNAIKEAAERTGARKVFLEEEPKVAAIGAGMDISKPSANMVIDIGGGTTDIAILSLNDIVNSASVRIAGNVFDQDIVKYIKEKYKLLIGEKTAEDIKIEFANLYEPDKKNKIEVRGRDLVTGLPNTIEINEQETEEALHESIYKIVKAATNVLEQTPPELSADIVDKGIILTGGGSMLKGLNEILKKELKVPVLIADSPLTCVVEGTGVLLDNIRLLEDSN